MSPATAGVLVTDLMDAGVVVSAGWNRSKVGRRSERLSLSENGPFVLGVDLSESDIRFGVVDLWGRVLSRASRDFRCVGSRADEHAVVEAIVEHLAALPMDVAGIGLAVPGIVDIDRRVIRKAVNLSWGDVALQPLLEARVKVPVTMEQHRKAALLAEEWWGAAQLADPAVLLMLGSGVGVGIKIAGSMVTGVTGVAGEIGHIPLVPDGPPCACGQHGCFETYASATALRARYRTLMRRHDGLDVDGNELSVAQIAAAAVGGDGAAAEALDEHARYLGLGLVTLINILNPQVVILGDEVMEAADLLLPKVRDFVDRHALPDAMTATELKTSSFDGEGSLIGAATVALEHLFMRIASN